MNHNQVTEFLKNYRSYRYAATKSQGGDFVHGQRIRALLGSDATMTYDEWDYRRYSRIVAMIDGAVDDVLSDDQRTVIQKKYLERNTMNIGEMADYLHQHRTTVSRWHKTAIKKLSIALEPLRAEEINNIDHKFDATWVFKEQESA